ncbi:ribonuclease Z [[Candida] anglica]|uniref:ribonuclease Z n=1 Tax=[Candida] anglica TaxID=148631 RepID=A0ABP0EK21_9ASCO
MTFLSSSLKLHSGLSHSPAVHSHLFTLSFTQNLYRRASTSSRPGKAQPKRFPKRNLPHSNNEAHTKQPHQNQNRNHSKPYKKSLPTRSISVHDIPLKRFPDFKSCDKYFKQFASYYKFTSLMFSITTITHKTSDTAHPLVMLTNREGSRYFFGKIPEGSQRVLNENRLRLGKLKSIFFTGTTSHWSELGGLPGLFLTISDSTKKSIDVFSGSSLLSYVVSTWRYFVFRKGVALKVNEIDGSEILGDSNIRVKPILARTSSSLKSSPAPEGIKKIISLMFPMDTSQVNSEDPNSYKSDPSETEIHTHVKLPIPSTIGEPSTNYLVSFVPTRGKFDPQRAKELGITPGKDFRTLSEGKSVINSAGVEVHSHEVLGKSKHFPNLLFIDIPNKHYLKETIEKIQIEVANSSQPTLLVYHFLPDDVDFESNEYIQFLQSFPKECKHVVSHSKIASDTLVFKTSAINLLKLKALQKECFNLPYREDFGARTTEMDVTPLQSLQKYDIEADNKLTLDNSLVINETWSELYDQCVAPLNLEGVSKEQVIDPTPIPLETRQPTLKDSVQVVTLGTGSALPSMHRNVISTLVRIPYKDERNQLSFRSILMDGGENSLGTMCRNFGYDDQLVKVFQELGLIYLSHLHADHHLGLVSVIKKWFEINIDPSKKLYLVTPWQYDRFLSEWLKLEADSGVDMNRLVYVSCEDFLAKESPIPEYQQCSLDEFESKFDVGDIHSTISRAPMRARDLDSISAMYADLNIKSIATCRAIHCYWAYSVSISTMLSKDETFTVSYSGDTRPNARFAEVGYNSDLLIHESSLAEDLIEEALAKKHSTMIEAVTVSKLMNCPKIILTHFSTRFSNKADLSVSPDDLVDIGKNIKSYLSKHGVNGPNNILMYDDELKGHNNPNIRRYDELEICYAFDSMAIWYGDLHSANLKYNDMLKMFQTEELQSYTGDLGTLQEKKDRELERQKEKREARRDQRLKIKKRRVSSSSNSSGE